MGGKVVWEPGQDTAKIELRIPNDEDWNAESLFVVYLEAEGSDDVQDVQSGVRVYLGSNKQMSVYALNRQTFPDGAYGSLTDTELEQTVRMSTLAWKFVKHNYSEIPLEAKKGLLLCIVPSLLYYVSQVNFGILVNCGLRRKEPLDHRAWDPILARAFSTPHGKGERRGYCFPLRRFA